MFFALICSLLTISQNIINPLLTFHIPNIYNNTILNPLQSCLVKILRLIILNLAVTLIFYKLLSLVKTLCLKASMFRTLLSFTVNKFKNTLTFYYDIKFYKILRFINIKVHKSAKHKIIIYLLVFSIFNISDKNSHYNNNQYQHKITNNVITHNNKISLYYLLITKKLGYIVYSKNISNNKKAKSYNGNINYYKTLKYMQFNKSNSHFQRKNNDFLILHKQDMFQSQT